MAEIQNKFSLRDYNTFGLSVEAEYFVEIHSGADIEELNDKPVYQKNDRLILGGGSNLLFLSDFDGLVIHPKLIGIDIIEESGRNVLLRAGCGVNWDDLVQYTVDQNFGGLENLSGIPGSVGASPVQNIGAYGAEVSMVIEKVEGYDLEIRNWLEFPKEKCEFGYRNSLFKKSLRNKFLITHVYYRLKKSPKEFITHYGSIAREFEKREQSLKAMRDLILEIRNSKLPDISEFGSAGSFFKNPVVSSEFAEELKSSYPETPVFPEGKGKVKLSAAWLIEQAGFKGARLGNAATHVKQPLVLINRGQATGKELLELAELIGDSVKLIFGVRLEYEVNVIK